MLDKKHVEIVKNVKASEICEMEESSYNPFTGQREAEYKWQKMTAKRQREIFGFAIFGKKSIKFNGRGISTSIKVAYGQDYATYDYTWKEIVKYVEEERKV